MYGCNHCTHSPSTTPPLLSHDTVIMPKGVTGYSVQEFTYHEEDVCTDSPGNTDEQADDKQMHDDITQ